MTRTDTPFWKWLLLFIAGCFLFLLAYAFSSIPTALDEAVKMPLWLQAILCVLTSAGVLALYALWWRWTEKQKARDIPLRRLAGDTALGFGVGNYKYAIALSLIPPFVRLLRPMVISILSSEYVEAARALGVGKIEIIARHVIPNITAPVLIHFSNTAAEALLTCTILSYVGIGVNPPMPEWGELVAYGYNYIRSQSNVSLIPCFVVAITALAMNLLGNGLRDALDPDAGDR